MNPIQISQDSYQNPAALLASLTTATNSNGQLYFPVTTPNSLYLRAKLCKSSAEEQKLFGTPQFVVLDQYTPGSTPSLYRILTADGRLLQGYDYTDEKVNREVSQRYENVSTVEVTDRVNPAHFKRLEGAFASLKPAPEL